jgi:NDP-sugar pyrophosphorylase family protein
MSESDSDFEMPTIAILCGGLATRLRPLTTSIPKSMLEVANEPFIAHQLRLLVQAGFRNIVLLCGHLGQQIERFVQDGSPFGCSVSYSSDGAELLGTGGAIRRALPLLGQVFMVIYGDSYCPTNYRSIHGAFRASGQPALMTVFRNQNQWDRSNVEFANHQIIRYDKNARDERLTHIDYGVSTFRSDLFELCNEHSFDLATIQKDLVATGRLAGFEVFERFYEIGSSEGLYETDALLRRQSNKTEIHKVGK